MNEVCAAALLAELWPGHALDRALAEPARILGDLLLQRIARKRGEHRPATRQNAEQRTQAGAAQNRAPGIVKILAAWPQIFELGAELRARQRRLLEVADDLDDAEQPDHQRHEIDPVPQFGDAEGVARQAAVHIGTDETEQKADQHHADRLDDRAVRQDHRGDEAQHHQRKIVGGVEFLRDRGERRTERRDENGADAAGEERTQCGDRKRRAGAPLLGHLMAVDAGDDGCRLAGNIDQDRCGGAAILRAIVDAGQHDQRWQRAEPEGDRQQHRDGRNRPDARQHADQRAEQAPDQRKA